MPSIRKARLKDLPAIARLEREIFGAEGHSLAVARQLFDLCPSLTLVAEGGAEAREIVGYAIGGLSQSKDTGWILVVACHPAYRGQGLGRRLSEKVIAGFRKLEVSEVFLTVFPGNVPARSLYAKLGFSEIRTIKNYFFDGSERVLMSRRIS